MTYALIDPNTEVYDRNQTPPAPIGYRVCEVAATEFEVANPLFWVSCADTIIADQYSYDPNTKQINLIPPYVPPAKKTTTGATVV
jgi:hypothetical protein